MNASKRIPQLLRAFRRYRDAHAGARLVLAGSADPSLELAWRIDQAGLADAVVREDYVTEDRLWALLRRVDAAVALRAPTMGETSAVVLRALSVGTPLVVSDVGWFSELPNDVALKAAPDEREVDTLVAAFETLSAPGVRETMGARARERAEGEHDLERVADLYAAALREAARVPAPSGARS
jgi:glycosyltransferase involved in cell wall biosynthesis